VPSPVPLIFLAFSLVWLQAFSQASAQMPSRGIYSDVTLPYLTLPNQQKTIAAASLFGIAAASLFGMQNRRTVRKLFKKEDVDFQTSNLYFITIARQDALTLKISSRVASTVVK
jgi:hypothetical protein